MPERSKALASTFPQEGQKFLHNQGFLKNKYRAKARGGRNESLSENFPTNRLFDDWRVCGNASEAVAWYRRHEQNSGATG